MTYRILGEARDCNELVEIYRERKGALGLTDRWFDEHSGLAQGHIGKLFGDGQVKHLGPSSIATINCNLAVKFIVVIDERQVEFMHGKWEGRERPDRGMPARASKRAIARFLPIIRREINQAIAASGGRARAKKLTPAKLSAIGRKGARARWMKKIDRRAAEIKLRLCNVRTKKP